MNRLNGEPVVFQIGFNCCGTNYLTALFKQNGYRARHWLGGELAENIAYSKQLGQEPFRHWPHAHMFADMESVHKLWRPMIEGFKEYQFLHRQFSDAVFILNECDIDEWIASRFCHQNGKYAALHAQHLGVGESELPELWRKDWETHISGCLEYFSNYARFFRHNIDEDGIENLAESLKPWYNLNRIPSSNSLDRRMRIASNVQTLKDHTPDNDWNGHANKRQELDYKFVDTIAVACIGECKRVRDPFNYDQMSSIFAEWDGKKKVVDKQGRDLPLVFSRDYNNGTFLSGHNIGKKIRVQGVINEIIRLGYNTPCKFDLEDARQQGHEGSPHPNSPVIVYNRRAGARNMVLWPLPGYHTPGLRNYVFEEPPDKISFNEKSDLCVWRGNLTGRPNSVLAPDRKLRRPSHKILESLIQAAPDSKVIDEIRDELNGITRYNAVVRLCNNRDFNFGITLEKRHMLAKAKDPFLAQCCRKREPTQWFYRFKYIASFSGHDTGSNFLMAANSNSVVLKEEDGWELFYTAAFIPWKHYIPLKLGALDLEEKLDWARKNQSKCREMSLASTEVCGKLANPKNRHAILSRIIEAYRDAFT